MKNQGLRCVSLMLVVTLLSACSRDASVSASDPVFQGLDPKVVSEVLANPAAQNNAAILNDDAERRSMWQGMVGAFVMCRQMLGVYDRWIKTGEAPQTFPSPEIPRAPEASFQEIQMLYAYFKKAVVSGDIDQLREHLTNQAGCGNWIPAKPNDAGGPTIAHVVAGR